MDGRGFLDDATREFGALRRLAERAVAQVPDAALTRELGDDGNSLGILMRHLAGNMRSRWTEFLTTDGEKPDRNRDGEFVLPEGAGRDAMLADWNSGWAVLESTLESLGPGDLERTITIRGEPHTVPQAVLRQLAHYAYHVGQIVQLARASVEGEWQSLSVPRGASEAFRENPSSYLNER